jgi:hypothetical protein
VVGPQAQARLERLAQMQLSAVGKLQVATSPTVMDTLAEQGHGLRQRLVSTARQLRGARTRRGDLRGGADYLAGVVQLDHPSGSNHRPCDTSRVIWSIR